jgi:hypothetical protein
MASGWFTLPLVRRAAQVVHTPEQQELGSGTPAASAAASTVWSARQEKLWLVPSRLAVIKKLGVSLTGMPWLGTIFAEGAVAGDCAPAGGGGNPMACVATSRAPSLCRSDPLLFLAVEPTSNDEDAGGSMRTGNDPAATALHRA